MIKVKHARTADCVVVGSLLFGLYDDNGMQQHVGLTSSFTMAKRRELVKELEPLRKNAMQNHPWQEWAGAAAESSRMPGAQSRWSAGKDLSWEASASGTRRSSCAGGRQAAARVHLRAARGYQAL